jgi:hypothetical protein
VELELPKKTYRPFSLEFPQMEFNTALSPLSTAAEGGRW